jgi:hypothetical protein
MLPVVWKMYNIMYENNVMENADNSIKITFSLMKQADPVWASFITKDNFLYV